MKIKNKMLWAIWGMPLVPFFVKRWYTLNELANFIAVSLPRRVLYWATIEGLMWATRDIPQEDVDSTTLEVIMQELDKLPGADPWDVKEN